MPPPAFPSGGTSRRAQLPDLNQPLSFDAVVDFALIHYPRIGANQLAIEVARRAVDAARADRLPVVGLGGGWNFTHKPNILLGTTEVGNMSDTRFGDRFLRHNLTLLLPLYTGGKITNQVEASELAQESATHRLQQSKDDLILDLAQAYYGILRLMEIIRARERSVEALQEAERRISGFVKVGTAPQLDLFRIQTRLANVRQDLVISRNQLEVTHAILATLMGLDATQRVIPADKLAYQALPLDIQAAINQALQRRPELRRLEGEVERKEHLVQMASAALKPQVFLELNYFGVTAFDAKRPGPFFTGDVRANELLNDYRAGINILFPVFNRHLHHRVGEERAALEQARKEVEQARLNVMLEVQRAYLQILDAEERIRATETALDSGREALRVEQLKLTVGKGVINDVLDAQADLLRIEENHAAAQADYQIFQVALQRAIGDITTSP